MSSIQKEFIKKERFSYSVMSDEELEGLHFDVLEVPPSSKILDTRTIDNFKTNVFSGPLKSKVVSALDKSIAEEKIEAANYWAFQLLFSGHINVLFDKLICIGAKQINIANPRLPTFILKKTIEWEIITGHKVYEKKTQIKLRNNQEIRHLIVEIVSLLTLSRKRKLEGIVRLKENDFAVNYFKSKLEAQDTQHIDHILKEEDPNEVRIAVNEFLYQLMKKNVSKTLYWLSWILEWEKIHVKKYKQFKVAPRYNDGIDKKFVTNVIWLIWEIINYVKKSDFDIQLECHQELNSLWDLYRHNFTLGSRSRKLIYLIWSIKFLTTPKCDWKLKLVERPYLYFHSLANVNLMAKKIKPHEVNKGIYQNDKYKILIQDNYIVSGNEKSSRDNARIQQEEKYRKDLENARISRIKDAKKKKISINSMNKMDTLREIDKYMTF
jgi:hypothetical protein